jgi:uncharacterized protein with von Willebrand factor type A (vWA) domain
LLVGFGRELRKRGLPVGTNRILTFCRSAAVLAPLDRDTLYWTGRSSLIAHPDHVIIYDQVFENYFKSKLRERLSSMFSGVPPTRPTEIELKAETSNLSDDTETGGAADDEIEIMRLIASGAEVLKTKSFEQLTDDERRRADRLIRQLAFSLPVRRSRRLHRSSRGPHFDLRRTLRLSLRTQGEPFRRAWQSRLDVARPLVLVLDVSGSMAPYARALMQFGYAAMASGKKVEVFCFGTRLTRVTRSLRTTNPDRALADVARRVRDWEGGTRIGESLKSLTDLYSQAAALKGAVVVLCSDGLERGDPLLLASQMSRLHRIAHEVVWVNPLKGTTDYEPLARGMAAALPHVDRFLSGHNVKSLEELCDALAKITR